jgi:predicted  nucleic acid-binding Zn-ribbon protein
MMDADTLKYVVLLLDVAQTLLIAVLWMRKPGQDAKAEVAAARSEMAEQRARIDVMAEQLRHIPTDAELAELSGRLSTAIAHLDQAKATALVQFEAVKEQMSALRASVRSLEDFLRHNR